MLKSNSQTHLDLLQPTSSSLNISVHVYHMEERIAQLHIYNATKHNNNNYNMYGLLVGFGLSNIHIIIFSGKAPRTEMWMVKCLTCTLFLWIALTGYFKWFVGRVIMHGYINRVWRCCKLYKRHHARTTVVAWTFIEKVNHWQNHSWESGGWNSIIVSHLVPITRLCNSGWMRDYSN